MTVKEEIAKQVYNSLVKKQDEIILNCIPCGIDNIGILDPTKCEIMVDLHGNETYMYDGIGLVTFCPPEIKTISSKEYEILQRYQVLKDKQ